MAGKYENINQRVRELMRDLALGIVPSSELVQYRQHVDLQSVLAQLLNPAIQRTVFPQILSLPATEKDHQKILNAIRKFVQDKQNKDFLKVSEEFFEHSTQEQKAAFERNMLLLAEALSTYTAQSTSQKSQNKEMALSQMALPELVDFLNKMFAQPEVAHYGNGRQSNISTRFEMSPHSTETEQRFTMHLTEESNVHYQFDMERNRFVMAPNPVPPVVTQAAVQVLRQGNEFHMAVSTELKQDINHLKHFIHKVKINLQGAAAFKAQAADAAPVITADPADASHPVPATKSPAHQERTQAKAEPVVAHEDHAHLSHLVHKVMLAHQGINHFKEKIKAHEPEAVVHHDAELDDTLALFNDLMGEKVNIKKQGNPSAGSFIVGELANANKGKSLDSSCPPV